MVDVATLVRGVSGALFVLLGLVTLVLSRRRGADRAMAFAFAVFALAYGGLFVAANVLQASGTRGSVPGESFVLVCAVVSLGALVAFAWRLRLQGREALGLGLAAALAAGATTWDELANQGALLAGYHVTSETAPIFMTADVVVGILAAFAVGLAAGLALQAAREPKRGSLLAAVALGLVLHPAVGLIPHATASLTSLGAETPFVLLLVATIALWLRALERGAGRGSLLVAIAVPFAMFAGQLEGVLQPLLIKQFENGVARTLEAAAFAIAIFHYDLLGVGLKARSASRASTATAALAALLITAQVAQNYLSATYGLLMGGVIAGAVVFAANPIQKHIERIGVHDRHVTTSSAASSRREETYKSAVRLALRGGIDPTEEVELMRIADANGIGNVRAAELRRQVVDAARRGERI